MFAFFVFFAMRSTPGRIHITTPRPKRIPVSGVMFGCIRLVEAAPAVATTTIGNIIAVTIGAIALAVQTTITINSTDDTTATIIVIATVTTTTTTTTTTPTTPTPTTTPIVATTCTPPLMTWSNGREGHVLGGEFLTWAG